MSPYCRHPSIVHGNGVTKFIFPNHQLKSLRYVITLPRVISSSEELLYATDIKYFYMISAPLPDSILPSATRRKLLRQRKIVWQNLKPNIPNDILSMRHASIVAWHSILTQEQIKYVQLPLSAGSDHADTIMWRQWNYGIDHCFSHAQDILVIATRVTL